MVNLKAPGRRASAFGFGNFSKSDLTENIQVEKANSEKRSGKLSKSDKQRHASTPSIALDGVQDDSTSPAWTTPASRNGSLPRASSHTFTSSLSLPSPYDSSAQAATGAQQSPVSPRDPSACSSEAPVEDKTLKRKSWLPGFRKSSRQLDEAPKQIAWVAGCQDTQPYETNKLVNAWRVPELWDDSGDTLVYLFPATSGKGPSFRIRSSIFASSSILSQLAREGAVVSQPPSDPEDQAPQLPQLRLDDASGSTKAPSSEDTRQTPGTNLMALFLPISLSKDAGVAHTALTAEDVETLVTIRNLFAFLLGQSLVCTEGQQTVFSVFMHIAVPLKAFDFSNIDGSTFGDVAASSFDCYVAELALGDVRRSREKTIEGLVLGESLKSVLLYNEAFTHAAGKYKEIREIIRKEASPARKFNMLSSVTRNRLERSAIDLESRRATVDTKLTDFEFPALFAGVFASKSTDERKHIDFDSWRSAFVAARKQVFGFYKTRYGSWPPKANTKSQLETPGLNRLVLKSIYHDFADVYDLWVDRASLTTRSASPSQSEDPDKAYVDPAKRLQRKIFEEYDRSTPPVHPPIPFDTVLLPSLRAIREDYGRGDSKKDSKARNKKLKEDDVQKLLDSSCNQDTLWSGAADRPFVAALRQWELKQAKGCNFNEICDLRCGIWVFIYVVLQSLPMLVVDAPAVRFHKGVEYFLCEPPRSGVPWVSGASAVGQSNYYRIAGGGGVVSLPSDLVEHGVEGVYRRSHCWQKAAQWSGIAGVAAAAEQFFEDDEASAGTEAPIDWRTPFDEDLPLPTRLHETAEGIVVPAPPAVTPCGSDTTTPGTRPGTGNGALSATSSRPASPARGRPRDGVLSLGLEALPLPASDARAGSRSRPPTAREPSGMTFDDILKGMEGAKEKKDKKKK